MKRQRILLWLFVLLLCAGGCKSDTTNAATPAADEITAVAAISQAVEAASATQKPIQATAEPAPATPTPQETNLTFSIIWFSDIQNYSEHYPEITQRMTEWIAENAVRLNAKYAIVTGDFVNHRQADYEWANAAGALSVLEGTIPLFTVAGNHDTQDDTYETYLSFFGEAYAANVATFGGAYQGGRGRYDLLDIGDTHLLLLGMGYRIDNDAMQWMNDVLAEYADRTAILCFHGYMDPDGSYTSDGKNLFVNVVAPNPNVKLVLCGHRHGVLHNAVACDADGDGVNDHTVYQFVSDYQDEGKGGDGYLNILTFDPASEELRVTAYSPYLDDTDYYDDEPGKESFVLPFALHSER